MSDKPVTDGGCCLPKADGITYILLGPLQLTVGMMGLETVFHNLVAIGHRPDEVTDCELVGTARRFNYIPDNAQVEADYANALRQAFAAYCARQKQR